MRNFRSTNWSLYLVPTFASLHDLCTRLCGT